MINVFLAYNLFLYSLLLGDMLYFSLYILFSILMSWVIFLR